MPSYQPAPVVAAPAPVMAPQQPLRTWIGKGYDPSKFTPRTYGDATMTPGIAYLPTSRVVRDPAAAQAVLNSGRTVPQSTVLGGTAPTPAMTAPMMGAPMMGAPVMNVPAMAPAMRAPVMNAPMMGGMNHMTQNRVAPNRVVTGRGSYGPTPPAVLTAPAVSYGNAPQTVLKESPVPMPAMAPVTQDGKTYVSNIGADGTYWEKTSGLTTFGSTVATQVICKRKVEQKVVNPVVGVPVPVPTRVVNPIVRVPVAVPTPVEIPVQQECVSVPHNHGGVMHGARGPRFVGMQPHMSRSMPARPMPAHPMNGRWTY
jgi:hypothetical protein